MSSEKITFVLASKSHLNDLRNLSIKTFSETYEHLNTPENFSNYIKNSFNRDRLENELKNPLVNYFLLQKGDLLIGYIKLNESKAQTDFQDIFSLEVERIYVLTAHHGKGYGKLLIEKSMALAKEKNKSQLWLGVWEKNHNAIDFYTKMGFIIKGTHVFQLGEDAQTDFVMIKQIN